jgi:hypothetical protein
MAKAIGKRWKNLKGRRHQASGGIGGVKTTSAWRRCSAQQAKANAQHRGIAAASRVTSSRLQHRAAANNGVDDITLARRGAARHAHFRRSAWHALQCAARGARSGGIYLIVCAAASAHGASSGVAPISRASINGSARNRGVGFEEIMVMKGGINRRRRWLAWRRLSNQRNPQRRKRRQPRNAVAQRARRRQSRRQRKISRRRRHQAACVPGWTASAKTWRKIKRSAIEKRHV